MSRLGEFGQQIKDQFGMSVVEWTRKYGITRSRAYKDLRRGYCYIVPKSGKHRHPLASTYHGMLCRCYREKNDNYRFYGGRGIRVCPRWFYSFDNFVEDMGLPPEGHTLDRIDNNGNYGPDNCRWATPKQQANNRRPQT